MALPNFPQAPGINVRKSLSAAWEGTASAARSVKSFAGKAGSKLVTVGVIGAALVGTVMVVAGLRGKRAKESEKELLAIRPERPNYQFSDEPEGPAEGYAPGQWSQTVSAGRAGGDMQRGNPANPRMSAVPESAVQDLGAAR